jgi:hypothetical protein
MTDIREIKKFLLRALNSAGVPMQDVALDQAAKDGIAPRPLQSDIEQAKKELETAGLLVGEDDALVGRTWSLSTAGEHAVKKIG